MVKVFLSYAEADTPIADLTERILQENHIKVSRYTNVGYRESFISYMNSLSEHDFVFCIISDAYLKSHACMYEASIMLRMDDLQRRMIWCVLRDCDKKYYFDTGYILRIANIYGSEINRIQYIKYWNKQHEELEDAIKGIDNLDGSQVSILKLNEISEIANNALPSLLRFITENRGLSFNALYVNGFKDVFDAIADEFITDDLGTGEESYNILHLQVDNDYYVYDSYIVYIKTCKSVVLHGGMNKLHNRITWFADEDVEITAVSNNITIEKLELHDTDINYNVVFKDELKQFDQIEFCIQAKLSNKHKHFKDFFSTEIIAPLRSLNVHLNIENDDIQRICTQKIATNIMNKNTQNPDEYAFRSPFHWHIDNPEIHCEYKIYWE